MWADYVAAHPEFGDETPPVEQFGDSETMADELLELVKSGIKRATAGIVSADPNEAVPTVGEHWIVADGRGIPTLVLLTTDVRTGPLGSVDEQFARDEGEGDRTRGWWLDAHRRFFRRTGGSSAAAASDDELDAIETVFERFRVVWPPEWAD